MAKNLKLNIKNTQLAEAFKIKKSEPAAEAEPKIKLSRLKEDTAVATAPKPAEKASTASKEAEAIPKKKARIMKSSPDEQAKAAQEKLEEEQLSSHSPQEEPQVVDVVEEKSEEKAETPKQEAKPAPRHVEEALSRTGQLPPLPPQAPKKELRPAAKKKEDLRFDSRGSMAQKALRYIVGIAFTLVLYLGPKLFLDDAFPSQQALVRFLRYALVGIWVAYGAPWCLLKMKLIKLERGVVETPSHGEGYSASV